VAGAPIVARAVLLDVEGTTSPIAFVHDVLFPYADEHLDAYVAAHREDPEVAGAMVEAAHVAGVEADTDDQTVLAHLHDWIANDRKVTPLKTLQGLIWKEGYERTGLRGRIYPDAADGLRRWHAAGAALYIYSSGSVEAQRVLFANSDQGDLSALFSGNFDTTIGYKRHRESYSAIAAAIGLDAQDIVFLSDVDAELDAAREAGMQTVRLLRPADTQDATTRHPSAISFDEIAIVAPR
jgi:enolase-phosphatase E1